MRNNNRRNKIDVNIKTSNTTARNLKKINLKTIYNLYKINFIDNCELILLEKQNNFLDKFFNKMKLIIKSEYDDDIFDKDKTLYEITKKCENDFISDVYWPMYDSCTKGFENFNASKNNSFLSSFLSHCNFEQIALHSCGSKFIQIISNSNSNEKLYAVCIGCKKCYFGSLIPVYCPFSQKKYFSKFLNEEDKKYPPATWEEYHCKNPIINEQMSCIQCGDKFWIKNDKLFCKKCKFEVDPLLIIWTCSICKTEFKSKTKVYNPLEYKEIENTIKEANIYKKIVRPTEMPCKCIKNNEIKNYDFCHKPNGQCKGNLYFGTLKNEDILVCSLCNSIYQINKFIWNCPICKKKFLTKNININSQDYSPNHDSNSNIQSEKKSTSLSENSQKSFYIKIRGTPIRELNSYVKKKPDDSYNYSYMKNKKRNLSITFTNKNSENILECNNTETNTNKNEKDNKYNTNTNFYIKPSINGDNIKEKEKNTDANSVKNKNLINNNEYFSPTKNEDEKEKKYTKIQLSSRVTKQYRRFNDAKRYASTSTRNYNYSKKANGEASLAQFKRTNLFPNLNLEPKKYQNYSHINRIADKDSSNPEIYVPKRKLDLNKANNFISFLKENKDNKGNKPTASNSVGIRERYKKLNKKLNNFYEKRNLKTMSEENIEFGNADTSKRYKEIPENKNEAAIESRTNTDFYKDVKSSSQYKLETDKFKSLNIDVTNFNKNKNKSTLNQGLYTERNKANINASNFKHKYNKRNIGNKYIFNYNKIKAKDILKNVYQKGSNNLNNKDKTGTNVSNGGENILVNNIIINNDNNLDNILNNKNTNEGNINSLKKEKNNYIKKNRISEKKFIFNDNDDKTNNNNDKTINKTINNNGLRQSFKNGANVIKGFENSKRKTYTHQNKNNSLNQEDELKEFNFNDYKIITQLGQGTFGKIYLVQDKNNELFSMKKIILSEELDVQSVINEYKMCQKLKHSNVVKILGIYNNKLDRTTYVVYVLMEVGLTDWEKEIRKYNDKNLEYTEKELIEIIKQLSSVLSFLQRNNISHRDIKPQNILVFKNSIYKVADFGEAKQIDNIAKNLINYSLRGTELYMSPLLFNGLRNGQIDIKHNLFKSDVYSLGLCVLYAAVTNNKPLYEIRKYVDMPGVKKYLEKLLKGKYSSKFLSLLISMLEIHEKNRPDFIELEKTMKNWK